MFAPNGWISLHEVYHQISALFAEKGRFGSIEYTGDENFEVTWLFLQEADEVAVCLPSGEALPVSRNMVLVENIFDNCNAHIDLGAGTVGSAHTSRHLSEPFSEFELSLHYGPFLHLPVILRKDNFDNFLEQLETRPQDFTGDEGITASTTDSSKDLSPKAISEAIISLVDKGELVNFDVTKQQLASKMSARQFRFAWNIARERRPIISKPGRKPTREKS